MKALNSMPHAPWVVSLTHFLPDGGLDETAMRAHFERLADSGQNVYAGSTNIGEGFALDEMELHRVLAVAAETLRGRVGIRAGGREARSVAEALAAIRIASDAGVEAFHLFQLDVGHASGKPDGRELERFYCGILDRCELPVVLSNYPKLGYIVPIDLLTRLADRFPQVIGIRDAGGDMAYLAELISRFSGRLEISSVGVRSMLHALFAGADTVMTTEANIAPGLVTSVFDAFRSGDLALLQRDYRALVSLHLLLNRHGGSGGRGMKPLLDGMGLGGGPLRQPREGIAGEEAGSLLQAIELLDLAEFRQGRSRQN